MAVASTSILQEKAKKRNISNIAMAPLDIQLAIFQETLTAFNDFFDTGDLRKLTRASLAFIVNDILSIIKGLLDLTAKSRLDHSKYLLSVDHVLEELRNARDHLQIALGMFNSSGSLREDKSAKFFAQLRTARTHIDDAAHLFR